MPRWRKAMPKFKEALNSGKFVITAEVGPPKGTDITETLENIDRIKNKVDAINSTDNQSSVMRIASLATCSIIRQKGGEPILQMTCRDRNRMGLESDLLGANILGIDNVLCLTGDYISVGDHLDAKPVFDIDSVQLVQMVRMMEQGMDIGGNKLNAPVHFCCGAIVTPEANPIGPQLMKYEKKVKAGIEFVQTQAIYDIDNFKKFMEYARKVNSNVKILAGIVLLTGAGMAKYMNANVPGIVVPDALIEELKSAEKGKAVQKGIEIAGRMIKRLKDEKICDGVHIMAIGREGVVPDILAAAGL